MTSKNNPLKNAFFDESKFAVGKQPNVRGLRFVKTESYMHTAKTFVNISKFLLPSYQKTELGACGQLNDYHCN